MQVTSLLYFIFLVVIQMAGFFLILMMNRSSLVLYDKKTYFQLIAIKVAMELDFKIIIFL